MIDILPPHALSYSVAHATAVKPGFITKGHIKRQAVLAYNAFSVTLSYGHDDYEKEAQHRFLATFQMLYRAY